MRKDAPIRLPGRAARALTLALLAAVATACGGSDGPSGPNNDGRLCAVASPTGTIAVGQAINGSLATSDCKAPDGTFADLYRLNIQTPTHVAILLESNAFDAYLVLLDADGDVIADDDNSAGGTDAGISGVLNAGTYYVGANSLEVGETGAYALSVIVQ